MGDPGDCGPDRRTLEGDLSSIGFRAGEEEGRWQLLRYEFPDLFVAIFGRSEDGSQILRQEFHIECSGYPDPGPFVERWDEESKSRPPAPKEGTPGFIDAMKDWSPNSPIHGGIYRAWQRYAAEHNNWRAKRPEEAWNANRKLTFVMEKLYELVSDQACWLADQAPAPANSM